MLVVHSHRFEQPGPPGARRPDGRHRDRLAPVVESDQAAGIGVQRPFCHDVPALLGERRALEGAALHRGARRHQIAVDDLDTDAAGFDRLGHVTTQRRPGFAGPPPVRREHVARRRISGQLDVRLTRRQHAASRLVEVGGDARCERAVGPHVGRRRHAQQPGPVEESGCEDPIAVTPDAQRRRGRVGAEAPEPPDAAGVQLMRLAVLLPGAQRLGDIGEVGEGGFAQLDGHPSIMPDRAVTGQRGSAAAAAGEECRAGAASAGRTPTGPISPTDRRRPTRQTGLMHPATPIDLTTWPRREHFAHYRRAVPCSYSMTVQLDATAFADFLSRSARKTYIAQIWAIASIVNRHDEFRMCLTESGAPAIWPVVHPAFTVFNPQRETFSCVWAEYNADFGAFHEAAAALLAEHSSAAEFFPQGELPANAFDVSSLPWASFTGFTLDIRDAWDHLAPIFTLGRYVRRGDQVELPLAVQIHHAAADGFHTARLVSELQELLTHPHWIDQ